MLDFSELNFIRQRMPYLEQISKRICNCESIGDMRRISSAYTIMEMFVLLMSAPTRAAKNSSIKSFM